MQNNLLNTLIEVLKKDLRFISNEWDLLKNTIREKSENLDENLISLLLDNETLREKFFIKIKDIIVFDNNKFSKFINNKEFLPDSYTSFKNKIGLTTEKGDFIASSNEVVLSFPFKDCVLAWWQDKDEQKRDEVFYNEILWQDDIDRLFDKKVFTNAKRYWKKENVGNENIHSLQVKFNRDENWTIKDNLIIKWNNLLALHSLKSNFAWKVKLIYIDPPYNTWNDSFNYNDKFNHSTWLTFMKNRLEVAKELLRDDWVIFVNLDDKENHYCKILCDDIFSRENFIANIIWQKKYSPSNDAKRFSDNHDHILLFAKNKSKFKINLLERTNEMNERYKNIDNDSRWPWKPGGFSVKTYSKEYDYPIETPSGNIVYPPKGSCWQTSKENYFKKLSDNRIYFGKNNDSKPQIKQFLSEVQQGLVPKSIWLYNEVGHNQISRQEINLLFGDSVFLTPKPEALIQRIIEISTQPWDIVLDYHLWSGTTCAVAHKMWRQYIGIEQMDYIENISVERMKKVIEWEQGGISKSVEWKWWWEFVYMEIMQENAKFIDEIKKIQNVGNENIRSLLEIYNQIKNSEFINYKVDIWNLKLDKIEEKDFEDFKLFLIEILDKNMLYKNYSERNDKNSEVSEEDKKVNEEFYKN